MSIEIIDIDGCEKKNEAWRVDDVNVNLADVPVFVARPSVQRGSRDQLIA